MEFGTKVDVFRKFGQSKLKMDIFFNFKDLNEKSVRLKNTKILLRLFWPEKNFRFLSVVFFSESGHFSFFGKFFRVFPFLEPTSILGHPHEKSI
jgi:hypothetical protein